MAIFDNELGENLNRDSRSLFPNPYVQSPTQTEVDTSLVKQSSSNIEDSKQETGLTLDQIANLKAPERTGFDRPFSSIPRSELLENQRYPLYRRDANLENIYGLQQSWYSRLGNASVKFAATLIGTFAQGFATLPNTIEAIRNGEVSDLSGAPDGYEASIDKWLKNLEDKFPNYYSTWEKEHPFRTAIPFTTGSANFWGDKVIKNLGFTAGAITNALAQDAIITFATGGIGSIPLISSQIGKASLYLNKILSSADKAEDVLKYGSKIDDQLLSLQNLSNASRMTKIKDGFKYTAALYGAARTEAAVEARDSRERVKEELIQQYKLENLGQSPDLDDMKIIEQYADDAMNTRFGVNMALLTVSNTVQFSNLFKSFTASNKALQSSVKDLGIGLKQGSIDTFEKVATGNKIWNMVKPTAKNMLAEGVYEEGGQFATEKGVYDYYTRKYKNANNYDVWNDLNETVDSTLHGLQEQFGSSEGLENMFIGAITSTIAGGVSSRIEKARGTDVDSRAKVALNVLNQFGLTGTLSEQYDNTLNSMSIAKEMEEAVKSGDVYKYNNLKDDMFFTYVMSRIPAGMHDVTIEQLNMLKDLSKEEFEKTFGMNFDTNSKNTVSAYVDALVSQANSIKKVSDSINNSFKNPFKFIADPKNEEQEEENKKYKTFNNWKLDLTYYAASSKQINNRLVDLQEKVGKIDSSVSLSTLVELSNQTSLTELASLYEQTANTLNSGITEITSSQDRKEIRNKVKHLRTLAEKIKLSLNNGTYNTLLFNELLNFELNGQDFSKESVIGPENTNELFQLGVDAYKLTQRKKLASEQFEALSSEQGFNKYFEQSNEVVSPVKPTEEELKSLKFKNLKGEEESIEVGRSYSTEKPKEATVKKIADDRFEVTDSVGNVSYYNTKEKADDAVKEINEDLQDISSVTALQVNPNGTVKVEDTLGNIYDISPSKLEGYEKVLTEEEVLKKDKEKLDKQQAELNKQSGTVATNSPEKDIELLQTEDKRKETSYLFTSTTSISGKYQGEVLKPHQVRHIEFLNNVKNFKNAKNIKVILVTKNQESSLGLDGITELSAGQKLTDTEITDINTGIVIAVYVQQIGNDVQFVDKEGNPIGKVGEKVDMNSVVFSTMPDTHLFWNDGKTARFRDGEKDQAIVESKRWTLKRQQLFTVPQGKYEIYGFSVSRGIPVISEKTAKNPVGEVLVPENKISTIKGLIQVPTTGTVVHQGKNVNFPNGRPVLSYGDTLQFVNNSKLTKDQVDTIYNVILQISNSIRKNAEIPIKLGRFLQNVLFYKQPISGVAIKNNQFWIDTDKMNIVFGSLVIPITKVEENKTQIIEKLQEAYNSINNKTLTESFEEPFVEYYMDGENLATREWKNYQTYLLSSTYPDGKKRSNENLPITTNIDKTTDAVPYNFISKYAILENVDMPALPVKPAKVEVKQETKPVEDSTKLGPYTLDGTTKNTLNFNSGPVEFTASSEGDEYSVVLLEGETVGKIVENKPLFTQVLGIVKGQNKFDPKMTDEQVVETFVLNRIIAELQKLKEQQTPAPAPVVEQPQKEVATSQLRFANVGDVLYDNKGNEYKVTSKQDKYGRSLEYTFNGEPGVINPKTVSEFNNPFAFETLFYSKEEALKSVQQPQVTSDKVEYTQETKPAKIEVTGPKKLGKLGAAPSEFRLVREGEKGQITDEEIEVFKKWAAENVPGIPYEILERIYIANNGRRAWGVFEQGVAKFYKGAIKGTEYHEVFEGIWKYFLSAEEKQLLLDEFRSNKGSFTDRATGKKIDYNQATDLQAKERIADDFANFRTGKISKKSLGQRILDFFKNIIEFFKFINTNKKDKLFDEIEKGRFRESKLPKVLDSEKEYSEIAGLTESQVNELVQDITARAFKKIFGENRSLYNIEKLTAPEIFDDIKEEYIEFGFVDNNDPSKLSDVEFNQLLGRVRDFLRTFKIEFDENNMITINSENVDNRMYAPEPFTTDWKKSSPFPVKLLIGSMTEAKALNQEDSKSLELPKEKTGELGGYKLFDFSRAFATLLNKLSNTSYISDVENKLIELAKTDSNYVRLFNRLGGDRNTLSFDFNKFEDHDWRLFINFFQTFTKQKPDAFIQYMNDGKIYTGSANLFTPVKQAVDSWIQNIRLLSKEKSSIIKYDSSTKTFTADVSGIKVGTPEEMITFLNKIGVDFSMEVYNKLSDKSKSTFANSVSAIHKHIASEKGIVNVTGESLAVEGQMKKLAEMLVSITNPNFDVSYFGIDDTRRQAYTDNNYASVFENQFNVANDVDELIENRPELNDVFSKNSVVLKKGGLFFNEEGDRIKDVKISYIQGIEDLDKGKAIPTDKLPASDRIVQEINQNLNGNYYLLIPADSATEWMINLGNNIKYEDVQDGTSWNKVYSIFKGYLKDEFALAKENRNYLKATSSRAKELRFFSEILSEKLLTEANKLIKDNATEDQIDEFINTNISDINNDIKSFIDNTVQETISALKRSNKVQFIGEGKFIFPTLDSNFTSEVGLKSTLTEGQLQNIIEFVNVNYIINNTELHKVIFGDPYQFKIKDGQLDETKRIKVFLSPRRTTFDSVQFNNFLNEVYNQVDGVQLTEKDPGYHVHKSFTKTATLTDVDVKGSVSNLNLPDKIKKAYAKTNETDGASWVMDSTYKEIKLKNGQWSEEAEKWYQWQMAYTRQNMPGYKYENEALKKHDEKLLKSPEPSHKIEVLKPIVSGVKNNKEHIELVIDKYSQMPIFYSMVEGTNLENLYIKMMKEKVGYVVFESGRKVGTRKSYNLYDENGKFNTEPFGEETIENISWKSYGIQVENSYEGAKQQTRGSQITKLVSLDMFNNGVPVSEQAKNEYVRNKQILDQMHKNGYKTLLKKLGIRDNDGNFVLEDNVTVSQLLERELLRREASENFKDVVKTDKDGQFVIPFEASSSYIQIRDILYSMVDKAILSPKMSGGAHVQVPSTLWESSKEGRKVVEVNGKKVFTDATLKFYTKEDPYCEVMLPAWFKDKLSKGKYKTDEEILKYLNSTEEGQSILKGIGFRIPTQSMSSIEVFRVKGFLPSYMGNTVVVPSEITTKAGSDFDIDKLNMYLKAVYIDTKGNIRLVKYHGSEQETKSFYGELFDKKLEGKKFKKSEILEALQTLSEGLEDTKGLIEKYAETLNRIVAETDDLYDVQEKLIQEIENLSDSQVQEVEKQKFIEDMYKASLENEYYDSLEKLLTLPENFERILSPVNDSGLKKASDKLDELRNNDETRIKNRLLNRNYMSSTRHAFIAGKKWVGIAAVNITGHSLTQKSEVFLDTNKFENIPVKDAKFLGDGRIALPHNTTAQGKISMSGTKTADNKYYISDRLSGYATSFVDVAKDPYILKIIKSELAIGTFMFLERIGVGENTTMFLNQPIIEKYLEYLDNKGSKNLFNINDIEYIKSQFITSVDEIASAEIDVTSLSNNIEKFYSNGEKFTSSKDNAVQHVILDEFLKYAKMAEYSFKLTQAYNYDTTSFRSKDMLFKKQILTSEAKNSNIFSSVDKILNESFIGEQSILLDYSAEALGEILKLDSYDLRSISDAVLKYFALKPYFSSDNFEKVGIKLTSSFLDYIIQTKSGLNGRIKELLVDKGNVAERVKLAQKEHPDVRILKFLEPTGSVLEGGAVSLKLKANLKSAYDENLYTEMFREMRNNPDTNQLYNDIVILSILQGTYQSAISIANVIPVEDRAKYISNIIKTLQVNEDISNFNKGAFYRNNWKDKNIVPVFTPKFFADQDRVQYDQYDNEIYMYSAPAFPSNSSLGISSSDRKLMILTEKYDSFYIGNDFLVVPRVIKTSTGMVDIKTGKTITRQQFAARTKKGDFSHKQVYGYQKVKYSNGQPVIFVEKGEVKYIYKLINLWGDGQFASEYYTENKPSVINNNTVKIENEIPDGVIINFFAPRIEKSTEPTLPAPVSQPTASKTPVFDTLPSKSSIPTMTYAGIGSRQTPPEILAQMTEVAKELEAKGYTLNTGVTFGGKKEGADKAFSDGATKKNLFSPENQGSRTKEQTLAKEIHPNPVALTPGALKLMARNTNQVFGDNLNTPVDFVLFYAKETSGIRPEGGTGQAVEMARRKGIPTINMANPNWKQELDRVLSGTTQSPVSNIEVVERYTDADVKANPDKIYVFGDNIQRKGTGGQAQIRNNPNAFGIATKVSPTTDKDAYFYDEVTINGIKTNMFDNNVSVIESDISKLKQASKEKTLVFPKDGLGTGLAKLKEKAPKTFAYLSQRLKEEFGFDNVTGSVSQPTQAVSGTTSATTINIYAGTGENAELSNFAKRPFTYGLQKYNTVEGAFQAKKAEYTLNTLTQEESDFNDNIAFNLLPTATGAQAKQLGRKLKKLDVQKWDRDSSKIMKELLKASFEQNPDALEKLFTTGNAELTHTQDKGKWGKEFPRLLMEVREELRNTLIKSPVEKTKEQVKQDVFESFGGRDDNTVQTFFEFGTEYRFEFNSNGTPIKGSYKQGGQEWKDLNSKNIVSKYNELVQKKASKAEVKLDLPEGQVKKSIFEIRQNQLDYTQGQRKALSDIENMIDSGRQGYYLLAGYAGTGKTTIAENIVKYAKQLGKEAFVLAPTNKAAKVLNDKLRASSTDATPMTIHRAIYGEPDPITGEWVPKVTMSNSLILVDESSMIEETVMNDLLTNTRNNNIVVFMGDGFQLEPVGKDPGLFKGKVSQINNKTELTEVKRQSLDSNILKVATIARMDNKAYIPSESTEDIKLAKSRDEFIKDFKESIKKNEDSVVIVATNNERILMNNIARIEKFGADRKVVNEGDTMIAISNSASVSNSELFSIDTLRGEPTKYTIQITDFKGAAKSYDLYLTYFKDYRGQEQKMMMFPDYDKASLYHAQLLKAIKESNRPLYEELDNGYDIINSRRGAKLSPAIIIGTYGYAMTAHKSQGSQWEKVFVNQNFVAPGWNAARWFYTAITRAANNLEVLPTINNTKIPMSQIDSKLNTSTEENGTDQIPPCI